MRRWLVGLFLVMALSLSVFWVAKERSPVRPHNVKYEFGAGNEGDSQPGVSLGLAGGITVVANDDLISVVKNGHLIGATRLREVVEKLELDTSDMGDFVALGAQRGYVMEVGKDESPQVLLSFPAVPQGADRIVIDKSENNLYWYKDGHFRARYPVATGKDPLYTPEGVFTVAAKIEHPDGADESKPQLGERWLGLAIPNEEDNRGSKDDARAPQGQKYGIHGTNEPTSIGHHASGGCIRMKNEDVLILYDQVSVGTTVDIRR